MKRKVVICGATGFIGRNLVETLARRSDLEVHAVRFGRPEYSVPKATWHHADLRRAEDVQRVLSGADVVLQAAATTSGAKDIVSRPYIHVTDNAVMNSLLLRAAFDLKVKHFVFFSCTVMHQSSDRAVGEDDFDANQELHPRYFGVGWTKVYVEKMCEFFSRMGVTKHTVVRHSNIYGPHDKFDLERSHVFGATVTKVMTSRDGKIVVWGTGEEARDLLYVDDLVDFVERAIDRQQTAFELFNVGVGEAVTIRDLVRKIIAASRREIRVEHDLSQPTIKTTLFLDCAKAERVLGWRPTTTLDDGIAKTIAWWNATFSGGVADSRRRG